jgi:hypothetical protein
MHHHMIGNIITFALGTPCRDDLGQQAAAGRDFDMSVFGFQPAERNGKTVLLISQQGCHGAAGSSLVLVSHSAPAQTKSLWHPASYSSLLSTCPYYSIVQQSLTATQSALCGKPRQAIIG